jgi:hypothetical protein
MADGSYAVKDEHCNDRQRIKRGVVAATDGGDEAPEAPPATTPGGGPSRFKPGAPHHLNAGTSYCDLCGASMRCLLSQREVDECHERQKRADKESELTVTIEALARQHCRKEPTCKD